jgi:cyclophilin family peptidyl-prolyl cis-trans isomerase
LHLASAEQRRDASSVSDEEMTQRDAGVRRRAARALARIADRLAHEKLSSLLHDEDPEVVRWSAYGLGYACKGREEATTRTLVLRAASLLAADRKPPGEVVDALSQALARCGTPVAERTLRAWLDVSGDVAAAAALGLGNLASVHQRLDDASVVALLDAATRPQPLPEALYAFSRLSPRSPTAQRRLLEAASKALEKQGLSRTFAVRALGNAGDEAAEVLGRVLLDDQYSLAERASAVRGLEKLGDAGQATLKASLDKLAPTDLKAPQLKGRLWTPLIATLEALSPPVGDAAAALARLAELALPPDKEIVERRRAVRLRCRAAALLAGRASLAARLVACDPQEGGRVGQLAAIRVLDQGPLAQGRLRRWQQFVDSKDPVVQQAALRLLVGHPEVEDAQKYLARALGSKEPGTVATAAQILAAYPARATAGAGDERAQRPHADVIAALREVFDKKQLLASIELTAALIDAVAALQLLGQKSRLEQFCRADNPTTREHAERALVFLGDKERKCDEFTPTTDTPKGLERALAVKRPRKLRFETDVGPLEITLQPSLVPIAVQRVLELVESGYYDGMAVHRVAHGFVVQFGDRKGDGYDNGGRTWLRCETSPDPFLPGDVGVALAGRDTGSSQLFVTLDRFPHLDGNYSKLGAAGPGWEKLAEGDRLGDVSIVE